MRGSRNRLVEEEPHLGENHVLWAAAALSKGERCTTQSSMADGAVANYLTRAALHPRGQRVHES